MGLPWAHSCVFVFVPLSQQIRGYIPLSALSAFHFLHLRIYRAQSVAGGKTPSGFRLFLPITSPASNSAIHLAFLILFPVSEYEGSLHYG